MVTGQVGGRQPRHRRETASKELCQERREPGTESGRIPSSVGWMVQEEVAMEAQNRGKAPAVHIWEEGFERKCHLLNSALWSNTL